MKKLILITLIQFIYMELSAQKVSEKELTGSWKVVKLEALMPDVREEQKESFEEMKQLFSKSKFHFKADHSFDFEINTPDLEIKDGTWTLDSDGENVDIIENEVQVMSLAVTKENGKTSFLVSHIFLMLEVVKE